MISIKDRKILGQIFSHYDYVMTTAQLSKEKLSYRDVQRMLEAGLIERIKRGYYHWAAGSGKGDVVIISRLFPDGILCMETALFYYGYSDIQVRFCHLDVCRGKAPCRTLQSRKPGFSGKERSYRIPVFLSS